VLGSILFRRRWLRLDEDARRRLPRIVIATAIMGAAVVFGAVIAHATFPTAESSSSGRLVVLIVLVTFGVAIHAVALRTLGIATLRELLAEMRARS